MGASLLEFVQHLPVQGPPRPLEGGSEAPPPPAAVASTASAVDGASSAAAEGEGEGPMEWSWPSIYSAPEQFVGLFAGLRCDSEATDVYRAAALALMALRARGPMDVPCYSGPPQEGDTSRGGVNAVRQLCHERVLQRAEGRGGGSGVARKEAAEVARVADEALPPPEKAQAFAKGVQSLLDAKLDLKGCGSHELEEWFRRTLVREPSARIQTAAQALEDLDAAWSCLEARLLADRRRLAEAEDGKSSRASARPRIVVERPPEFDYMKVL